MKNAWTIRGLVEQLRAQRSQLGSLKKERRELAARIRGLDRDIEELRGARAVGRVAVARRRRRGRGRAPTPGVTLADLVVKVLADASTPLGLKDIAEGVLAAGYKTTSSNFLNVIGQYVYNSKVIRRVRRGKYALKKGAMTGQAAQGRRKA
jgi:hypothetical protein